MSKAFACSGSNNFRTITSEQGLLSVEKKRAACGGSIDANSVDDAMKLRGCIRPLNDPASQGIGRGVEQPPGRAFVLELRERRLLPLLLNLSNPLHVDDPFALHPHDCV